MYISQYVCCMVGSQVVFYKATSRSLETLVGCIVDTLAWLAFPNVKAGPVTWFSYWKTRSHEVGV